MRETVMETRGEVMDGVAVETWRGEVETPPPESGIYGRLYRPRPDAFPGKALIVFGGSDGRFALTCLVAEAFWRRGLTALALAYWNAPGLAQNIEALPVEAVERSALYLKGRGCEKVGVWGISLGGELALLSASLMPERISCAVAVSPLHAVTQGIRWKPALQSLPTSAFSWRGAPLPYVELGRLRYGRLLWTCLRQRQAYLRYTYEEAFSRPAPEGAEIAVENIAGPVLLLTAEHDAMCPAKLSARRVVERLAQHGFRYPVQHRNYEYISHYILPFRARSSALFRIERTHPQECAQSRIEAFEHTLEFLKMW